MRLFIIVSTRVSMYIHICEMHFKPPVEFIGKIHNLYLYVYARII